MENSVKVWPLYADNLRNELPKRIPRYIAGPHICLVRRSKMKIFTTILFTLLLALCTKLALADAKMDVDQAEDRRYEVMIKGDLAGLEAMLADEFKYHQPTGNVASKSSYIEQIKSGAVKIYSARRHDVTIHVYGDVATAMGMTHLDIERKGDRSEIELRYINVWVHRDGRWQLSARQSAFLPKAP
jgi:ketosteroid isomerase-like protein